MIKGPQQRGLGNNISKIRDQIKAQEYLGYLQDHHEYEYGVSAVGQGHEDEV